MTSTLPLLSITIFLPLLGALAISLNWATTGNNARWVALWTTLGTLAMTLILWKNYNPLLADFQLEDKCPWIPLLTANYHVGVDGISLPFILLSALLMPICILASWTSIQTRVSEYMIAFLILETMLFGLFS